ncbi:uncharacterized protein LOC124795352 isoform X1 [Schistocerca piceifrons]|uniref:uncharacterized protein LOC124795352 isoform X1 n=2 Tax=Schistocerca piceifrons TaxID=274613 RepID=UPI001F5E6259|nr:uncharacterized protein LOC124795352 isoform X1 [Schistocerca piceifrons]
MTSSISQTTDLEMDDHSSSTESGSEEDIMDIHNLCRLCAIRDTCLIPLFGFEGKQYGLEVKIKKYLGLPIKLFEDTDMPHSVCYNCAAVLLSWHSLYTKCMEAQKKLKSLAVIAMAYRMSTKESQCDGVFSMEEHNLSTRLECDPLCDDGSNTSDELLHGSEGSVKPDASRLEGPEITAMISGTSPLVVDNSHFLKLNEEEGTYSTRTTYIHPHVDRPVSKFALPRAEEVKQEPPDCTSDSENENSSPLSADNMWDSKKVNEGSEFVCGHCNEKFSVWRNLDVHFQMCHRSSQMSSRKWYSDGLPEDSYVQVFHCMVCDRSFLHTAQHFMKHMKSHESAATALLDHDYC